MIRLDFWVGLKLGKVRRVWSFLWKDSFGSWVDGWEGVVIGEVKVVGSSEGACFEAFFAESFGEEAERSFEEEEVEAPFGEEVEGSFEVEADRDWEEVGVDWEKEKMVLKGEDLHYSVASSVAGSVDEDVESADC